MGIRKGILQKICIYSMLLQFISFTAAQDQNLDHLQIDIKNIHSHGLRPLCFGKEYYIKSQGQIESTFSSTDFSIMGNGFFVLFDPAANKILLTRNGNFHYDFDGHLVNHDNMYVLHSNSIIDDDNYLFITINDLKKLEYSERSDTIITGEMEAPGYLRRLSFFLILEPCDMDSAKIIDSEYIACKNYRVNTTNMIIQSARERFPADLKELLKITVKLFANNRNGNVQQKEYIYSLLYNWHISSPVYSFSNLENIREIESLLITIEELLGTRNKTIDVD
jgi:hypothetical protein